MQRIREKPYMNFLFDDEVKGSNRQFFLGKQKRTVFPITEFLGCW